MDTIFIQQLRVETLIGLYPWEKQARQTLLIDMELRTDIRRAAADDDLHHTINYEAVCQSVSALATQNQFHLIETLAEKIAALLLKDFATESVKVTLHKVDNMTEVAAVGVSIERP